VLSFLSTAVDAGDDDFHYRTGLDEAGSGVGEDVSISRARFTESQANGVRNNQGPEVSPGAPMHGDWDVMMLQDLLHRRAANVSATVSEGGESSPMSSGGGREFAALRLGSNQQEAGPSPILQRSTSGGAKQMCTAGINSSSSGANPVRLSGDWKSVPRAARLSARRESASASVENRGVTAMLPVSDSTVPADSQRLSSIPIQEMESESSTPTPEDSAKSPDLAPHCSSPPSPSSPATHHSPTSFCTPLSNTVDTSARDRNVANMRRLHSPPQGSSTSPVLISSASSCLQHTRAHSSSLLLGLTPSRVSGGGEGLSGMIVEVALAVQQERERTRASEAALMMSRSREEALRSEIEVGNSQICGGISVDLGFGI
jgi:hypothetical protein